MIVKFVLAAVDGPGASGPAGTGPAGAGPGQLAGGAASLLRIKDSETGSGSNSQSKPPADQNPSDPPEQDSASESEAS